MKTLRNTVGGLIIFIFIVVLGTDPLMGLMGILLGLSITHFIWEYINKKRGKNIEGLYIALTVVLLLAFTIFLPNGNKTSEQQVETEQAAQVSTAPETEADIANYQKDLDEVLRLATEAGIVSDYEFSETKRVVYIGPAWYNQTVALKEQLLNKTALLLEKTTGFHRFEVRDAYSNELVGEVTAFSGSVKIYK